MNLESELTIYYLTLVAHNRQNPGCVLRDLVEKGHLKIQNSTSVEYKKVLANIEEPYGRLTKALQR